ncbi:MAG: hypothetical protein H7333_11040 [Bdellovibrionales bacterium]|nr:hypothetical protein [Oligoflexia bacterium]
MLNQKGQFLAEFSLVSLLVMVPLMTGGIAWFCLEMNRAKCAYQVFYQARKQLIIENRSVDWRQSCGSIQEFIHLSALEDLDHNKGALGPADMGKVVSQFSADASHSLQRLQELGSSRSSTLPGP